MIQRVLLCVCALLSVPLTQSQDAKPLLLRRPTISKTQIVFNYGGDLWSVSRDGGQAFRLTTATGVDSLPFFSPDGSLIAFSGNYAGNDDVYVVPAQGGEPRRLTYHPSPDQVVGWSPDGKKVVFRSNRSSYYGGNSRLYTVSLEGGFPTELPLPIAEEGSLSPDGTHIAYVPHTKWQRAWKRYRGGQTTPIWIANLADSSIERIPRDNSNDFNPMWVGNTIYFLSDRNGPVSLFAYDIATKQVSEVVKNDGLDFKSAAAGPDAIVIEQFGALKVFDTNTRQVKDVSVQVAGDLPQVRPQFVKVEPKQLRSYSLSPAGVRAVASAFGEIFTIPSDKGDIRNLTHSPAVADRDPAWSPDGKWIAYFSDEPGEYELQIREQNGMGKVRHINLGTPPSFFYSPVWSPDSKKIAYTDKRLNLWYVDVDTAKTTKVDSDYYDTPLRALNPAWSPDSKWLTYTKQLPSHLRAVFVYSLAQNKTSQITDGMSDSEFANFDKNGKYLYFAASTDIGLGASWLDMSSLDRPLSRNVYVVVLNKDDPSPLAPESDEEKINEAKKEQKEEEAKIKGKDKGKKGKSDVDSAKDDTSDAKADDKKSDDKKADEPVTVKIDFDGIGQRILALPIPAKNYLNVQAGKTGILFLAEGPIVVRSTEEEVHYTLQKFDLSKRKVDKFLDDLTDFSISSDGSKLLYKKAGDQFGIASADEPPGDKPKPGEGPLKLDAMQVYIEPHDMWKQIYRETWRIERDFLYDPNHHGLDLAKVEKKYEPYLDRLGSREELTYLFEEALGEITVGHMFVGGGYTPEVKKIKTGLLGADYTLENGRYRIARVYNGENWNPDLQAPLTQPGVNAKPGEYILAVNGRDVQASDDIYRFFEDTAGKQVSLKIGPNPDGKGSREVTVVPVDSETGLRQLAWIENNRRKVDELSDGRVAYVYLPDTAAGGFTNFNRYYFAQVGKQAAVLDERFNQGGDLADYIIDNLRRPLMSRATAREGEDLSSPAGSIYGPKVMITNEMAGSGGDAMPWYFRKAGIGPLVGKKTWGGLVGIYDYPELIDGGYVTAPRVAIYGLKGDWEVENTGIAPDYDVDLDPAAVRKGHDPQLEKAVEIVLQQLKEHPLPDYRHPAYPNYHRNDVLGINNGQAQTSNSGTK
jgi:tricorn protease